MVLHFYLRFSSQFGQNLLVSGNSPFLGNDDPDKALPLEYLNAEFWHGVVEIDPKEINGPILYKYLLRQDKDEMVPEFGCDRLIKTDEIHTEKLVLTDTWNHAGEIENSFFTSAFKDVLLQGKAHKKKDSSVNAGPANYTHEFRVKAPLLKEHEAICISGSAKKLHDWNKEKPLPLVKNGNWWTIRVNLSGATFPLAYKYGVFDLRDKKLIQFEDGNNRVLISQELKSSLHIIHDGFARFKNTNWKGAGVAIPVFSLRSKTGFGTGEFTDLNLLVDWAMEAGIKMIQLLPVNDTTATYSWKDSYPYSAISAFALHPLLLNLDEVAGKGNTAFIKRLSIKKKQLNKLAEIDYEQVIKFKMAATRELYELQKENLKNDFNYFTFFELNRHWLEPYAAFSYLRDKYSTAEFSTWRSNSEYNETAIQRLVSPSQKHYDDIAVYYFMQYHLHLQLKAATAYAHRNGIVFKGDIPIGICRNSVDAWMEPGLYFMDEQAGAPPDAFTVKGQNWGFPTYNWKVMQEDNFTWWRKRFEQMSNYFDAFRIDHILGFFRIWSIPAHAVEGIMGRFVPAIPVHINEIFAKSIVYERHRYTKPFIDEAVLDELFGEKKEEVKKEFLDGDRLKEKFDTQRKVEEYFAAQESPDNAVKQGLFDLISNVILFEVEGSNAQDFHFRIAMEETLSFKYLDPHSQDELRKLYLNYFYKRQDEMWRKEAMKKLPGLKSNTEMLVCGEDLGMVPHCVPEVMAQLGILSLEIQRMPKKTGAEFFHPNDAPYLSVVSPSTHDMSTIREWWEEDAAKTNRFYHDLMGQVGAAPFYCEPWICKEILLQHLYSPAMWSVFQLQDLLGMSAELRRENPAEERINNPSDPDHYWNYRMHINLEDLIKETGFNQELKGYVKASGR
jgi:4-alpha-glucanotransferase